MSSSYPEGLGPATKDHGPQSSIDILSSSSRFLCGPPPSQKLLPRPSFPRDGLMSRIVQFPDEGSVIPKVQPTAEPALLTDWGRAKARGRGNIWRPVKRQARVCIHADQYVHSSTDSSSRVSIIFVGRWKDKPAPRAMRTCRSNQGEQSRVRFPSEPRRLLRAKVSTGHPKKKGKIARKNTTGAELIAME